MQEQMPTVSQQNSAEFVAPERQDVCDTHGPFVAKNFNACIKEMMGSRYIAHWSKCPACADEAQMIKAEAERTRLADEKRRKIESIVRSAGIPPRFQTRSFDDYTATNPRQNLALTVSRKFVSNWVECEKSGRSMIFTGGPGTGKTHLACAIARAVAEQHLATPLFMSVTSALRHIKSTYRKDSEKTEHEALAELIDEPDLLIIDEIGVQVGSDHEKLLLFEILNERYQYLKPTILISNLNLTELEGYLGQRIMDRYRECGAVIAFDWESHRGAQA